MRTKTKCLKYGRVGWGQKPGGNRFKNKWEQLSSETNSVNFEEVWMRKGE